uniref:hypothetical protein n=1 Tax=Nocardia donostiensis TaxID=1538463 RepID=UPI00111BF13F|nr:hypothetical protein [Nocardia donostiensis]
MNIFVGRNMVSYTGVALPGRAGRRTQGLAKRRARILTSVAVMMLVVGAAAAGSGVAHAAPQGHTTAGATLPTLRPDGRCLDIATVRDRLEQLEDAGFRTVRLNTAAACDLLSVVLPIAQRKGIGVDVGLAVRSEKLFDREKIALERAFRLHGFAGIGHVIVGREALERREVSAARLADSVREIKDMLQHDFGYNIPVGVTDTLGSWADPVNAEVLHAVDFIGLEVQPYRGGAAVEDALTYLRDRVAAARLATKPKPLVVETGWPSRGPERYAAAPGIADESAYYYAATTWLISQQLPFTWHTGWDDPTRGPIADAYSGLWHADGEAKFPLTR